MFILREKRSQIEVYDCTNFTLAPTILDVKELVAAVDICSCKKNNCLYIIKNKKGTGKEVMKIDTEVKFLGKWSTKDNAGGYLSATTEGNVIITVQNKQMLLEYSHDGKLVRDIKLPECTNPWHAIKLDDDHYIVSHGILSDPFNRVCLVDRKGNVEKSFGHEVGSTGHLLNMPLYLAAGTNGYVMVADFYSNRVLLLDSNLKFKTNIVPKYKQRFRNPRRVQMDENLGLLVVVIVAGNPAETIPEETGESREDTEEGVLLREEEEGEVQSDPSKKIEKDCRLLVFDIKPLLQKYAD